MRRPRVQCTCCSIYQKRRRHTVDTPVQQYSPSTSTSAAVGDSSTCSRSISDGCSGRLYAKTARRNSSGGGGCSLMRATWSRPRCRGTFITPDRSGRASYDGGSILRSRGGSSRDGRGTCARTSWSWVDHRKARSCSCTAMPQHTLDARPDATALGMPVFRLRTFSASAKPFSTATEGHVSSCGGRMDEAAPRLWDAFFAGETGLGLLLLQELQRQMRAQHLQEENLLTYFPATASSLPEWLDLSCIYRTVAAGAAAAVAPVSSAPLPPPPRSAAAGPSLRSSSSQAPTFNTGDVLHAHALHQRTGGLGIDNYPVPAGAAAARGGAWASCVPRPCVAVVPAAGPLMGVDRQTLRRMLYLLPIVAFKECEQVLRYCETAAGRSVTGRVENTRCQWPSQLLGEGTCDAMVRRLTRMLLEWKRFLAFLVSSHTCTDAACNTSTCVCHTCSRPGCKHPGETFPEKPFSSVPRCLRGCSKLCNRSIPRSSATTNNSRCSYSSSVCRPLSGETESTTHYRDGCDSPNRDTTEYYLVLIDKSLVQLLRQILYPQALITAAVWGRQLHLRERCRHPRGPPDPIPTALPLSRHPAQLYPFQPLQQEAARTSRPPTGSPHRTEEELQEHTSGVESTEAQSLHQQLRGPQQSEWLQRRESRRQQRRQQTGQPLQSQHFGGDTLQLCLQRLLLVLQRAKSTKEEGRGNLRLIEKALAGSQGQQLLVPLYVLQLLSFCGVRGEVSQATDRDSHPSAGRSALCFGNSVGEPADDSSTEGAQQHLLAPLRRVGSLALQPVGIVDGASLAPDTCRLQFAPSSGPAEGDVGRTRVDEVSARLWIQLLLCDSQLYIHPATPPVSSAAREELSPPCRNHGGLAPLMTTTQQAARPHSEPENARGITELQCSCESPGSGALLARSSREELPQAGATPGAALEGGTWSGKSEGAAPDALPFRGTQVAGVLCRQMARLPHNGITGTVAAEPTGGAESRADKTVKPSRGACEVTGPKITSAGLLAHYGKRWVSRGLRPSNRTSSSPPSQAVATVAGVADDGAKSVHLAAKQHSGTGVEGTTCTSSEQANNTVTVYLNSVEDQQPTVNSGQHWHAGNAGAFPPATSVVVALEEGTGNAGQTNAARDYVLGGPSLVAFPPPMPVVVAPEERATEGTRSNRTSRCAQLSGSHHAAAAPLKSRVCVSACSKSRWRNGSPLQVPGAYAAPAGSSVNPHNTGSDCHSAAADALRSPARDQARRSCKCCLGGGEGSGGEAAERSAPSLRKWARPPEPFFRRNSSSVSACGPCSGRCIAQRSRSSLVHSEIDTGCCTLQGNPGLVRIPCYQLTSRSVATTSAETTSINSSQRSAPRECPHVCSRYPTISQCKTGHPLDRELSFRPIVLRISLLRIRGSFRSLLRTCTPTPPIPGAAASTTQKLLRHDALQQQDALQQRVHLQQHHLMGVDLAFRPPKLAQQHEPGVPAVAEPSLNKRRTPAAGRAEAGTGSEPAEGGVVKAEVRATVDAATSWSAMGPGKSTRPSQASQAPLSAPALYTRNLCPECKGCNCCDLSEECGSCIEGPTQDGERSNAPQPAALGAEACRASEKCWTCFMRGAAIADAVEPEDVLVCCFFDSGAVTLNGRFVRVLLCLVCTQQFRLQRISTLEKTLLVPHYLFFEHGGTGDCFPCIVDVLLLPWYGADPILSDLSSPGLLRAARLCADLAECNSITARQYTPSTASTCSSSSSSSSSRSRAPSASDLTIGHSTSGRPNRGGTTSESFVDASSAQQNGSSSWSRSPVLGRRALSVEGSTEESQSVSNREVNGTVRSDCAEQPHICLLFLAGNGTLFCSGDVPSVHLPQCGACGESPACNKVSRTPRSIPRSSAPASASDHKMVDRGSPPMAAEQENGTAPSLTRARYGTLYDAVWLPAVCAVTHRPLLFGSLLAGNTAAVALTSNLLLPRYKRRVPLHKRQLSYSVLTCKPSPRDNSLPEHHEGIRLSFPGELGLPDSSSAAVSTAAPATGRSCSTRATSFADVEGSAVLWAKAAVAAGSGAAVAVLQTHTGEPVLLQQHRREAQNAAALAVWRGGAAALGDANRPLDSMLKATKTSGCRYSQAAEGTPPGGPAKPAGFILRFVSLPDPRKCNIQRHDADSATSNTCSSCSSGCFAEEHSRSVDCRSAVSKSIDEAQARCVVETCGFPSVTEGEFGGKARLPATSTGRQQGSTREQLCDGEAVEQNSTFWYGEKLLGLSHCTLASINEARSSAPALSFVLEERWLACCLYKDVVLLKTAGRTDGNAHLPARGLLLSNLEGELHEWLARFFESHPHVVQEAKYLRLGFERVSKRCPRRCSSPFPKRSVALIQGQHRTPRIQRDIQFPCLTPRNGEGSQEQRHSPRSAGLHTQAGSRSRQQRHAKSPRRLWDNHAGRLHTPQQFRILQASRGCNLAAEEHEDKQAALNRPCEECRKCEPTPRWGSPSPCSRIDSIVHVASAGSDESPAQCSMAERQIQTCTGLPRRKGDPSGIASVPAADEVREDRGSQRGQLHQVTSARVPTNSTGAGEDELLDLEEGDGDLRLFVNTAGGRFYCLNLQRRCLETAWPEGYFESVPAAGFSPQTESGKRGLMWGTSS